MNFSEYQKEALKTDNSVGSDTSSIKFFAIVLGLLGEAGEVGEKMKKIYRDKNGIFSEEDKENLQKELGDVLWYISSISNHMGSNLEEIAKKNIEKLSSRKERGAISGSGDNR